VTVQMNYRKKIRRTGVSVMTRLQATRFSVRIPAEAEVFLFSKTS